jgi:hypothetical protein
MKVPLLDLRAQHESLCVELLAAMQRVMDAQLFILGPEVRAFEEEIAGYTKTRHATRDVAERLFDVRAAGAERYSRLYEIVLGR